MPGSQLFRSNNLQENFGFHVRVLYRGAQLQLVHSQRVVHRAWI